MSAALLLVPDFSLILLGVLLFRYGSFGDAFWAGLERMVYFILFPSLLFYSTATAKLDFAATTDLLLTGWAVMAAGIALGYAARPLFRGDATIFASGVQTAFRFNSYIALAIAGRVGGSEGVALMALLIGVNVPLANVAAVYALARHGNARLIGSMIRNPLIIATLSGLSLNLLGIHLPEVINQTLSRLGNASIALGLIAVGSGLRLNGAASERGMLAWWLAVKLLVLPAVAWVLCDVLQLPPLQRHIAVLFAAMPTASSAYILAARMGGNGPVVAFLISAGTVLSILTLPVWLIALQ